jgi:hypothetical protein
MIFDTIIYCLNNFGCILHNCVHFLLKFSHLLCIKQSCLLYSYQSKNATHYFNYSLLLNNVRFTYCVKVVSIYLYIFVIWIRDNIWYLGISKFYSSLPHSDVSARLHHFVYDCYALYFDGKYLTVWVPTQS